MITQVFLRAMVAPGTRTFMCQPRHRAMFFFCFFYKEDLLTYKNLQKYATKYIHMYNMKYNKMAA